MVILGGMIQNIQLIRKAAVFSIGMSFLITTMGFAEGLVGLDTSSFYQSNLGRPTSSTNLVLGVDLSGESRFFAGRADVRANLFLAAPLTYGIEVSDLYVATARRWTGKHQVSFGRRNFKWTELDDFWELGFWAPRYNWDPVHPVQAGLNGLFYTYGSGKFHLKTFVSALAVPERGVPFRETGGDLDSPSHGWVPLPRQMSFLDQDIAVKYRIQTPSIGKILFRPHAGLQAGFGEDRFGSNGGWFKASYGYLPIHQTDIAVDGRLNPGDVSFDADIHPQFLMHHVVMGEMGFRTGIWKGFASVGREIPENVTLPEEWIHNDLGPANIYMAGGGISRQKGFSVLASYLYIQEKVGAPNSEEFGLSLPSRFQYKRAAKLLASLRPNHTVQYRAGATLDLENRNSFFSMDVDLQLRRSLRVSLGSDIFVSDHEEGFIGQFAKNDRVRGKVTYAF